MTANINQTPMTFEQMKAARAAARANRTSTGSTNPSQAQIGMATRLTQPAPVAPAPVVQQQQPKVQPSPVKRILKAPMTKQATKEVIGNIGTAPEPFVLPSGTAVVRFTVAVRQTEYDNDGTLIEKRSTDKATDATYVDWYRINVWDENGENELMLKNVLNLEVGHEVRVFGIYTIKNYDSTRNPGTVMQSKEIRAKELDLLTREYVDGNLVYAAYSINQPGIETVLNTDAQARFERQANRQNSYQRRLQQSQEGDIPPVQIQPQTQAEADEGFGDFGSAPDETF